MWSKYKRMACGGPHDYKKKERFMAMKKESRPMFFGVAVGVLITALFFVYGKKFMPKLKKK